MTSFSSVFKILAILTAIVLAGCAGAGTDNTPAPVPLASFKPDFSATRLWSTSIGHGVGSNDYLKLGPFVADDKIFIGSEKSLTAVAMRTGHLLWHVNTQDALTSGPCVRGNILLVATNKPELVAIDTNRAAVLWRAQLPNQTLATPQIANDRVIVKTVDGKLTAFSMQDGQRLWTYDHGSPMLVLRASSAPQIKGNLVIAGFPDGKLIAVTASQGKLQWEQTLAAPIGPTQIEQLVDVAADPLLASNIVYAATYQGKIAAIHLQTGRVLWQRNISTYTGFVLGGDTLFVTDAEGYLWAFNCKDGSMRWKQTQLQYHVLTAPILTGNDVVVADAEGYLYWLNKSTGRIVARALVKKKTPIMAPPVSSSSLSNEPLLFVVTSDGLLTAWRVPQVFEQLGM